MNTGRRGVCVSGLEMHVVSAARICRDHVRLVLEAEHLPDSSPGQFVQICCRGDEGATPRRAETNDRGWPVLSKAGAEHAFLRRPFSIADRRRGRNGGVELAIISRTVGSGTSWLAGLKAGEKADVTGPLGRGFRIPGGERPLILVGGGVGIPPLLYLTRLLCESGKRDVTCIFGATTTDLLPLRLIGRPSADGSPGRCVELAGGADYPAVITTDDGSAGLRGSTTEALRILLESREMRAGVVFACGPEPMLGAVADLTLKHGSGCQLCIERMMGCGLGGCLSCIVRLRDDSRIEGWRWGLTCKDGPVFDRDELMGRG